MSDVAASTGPGPVARPQFDHKTTLAGALTFLGLLAAGIACIAYGLNVDFGEAGMPPVAIGAFVLLGLSLLIAPGLGTMVGWKRIVVTWARRSARPT